MVIINASNKVPEISIFIHCKTVPILKIQSYNFYFSGTLHAKFQNKGYFFSWRDPITAKQEEDWLGVRNWCRKRCMDSISLQTSEKNDWAKQQLIQGGQQYI